MERWRAEAGYCLAFVILLGLLVAGRYYAAAEDQTDLGIFAQSLSSTFHGRFLYNTVEGMCTHGVNFSPVFLLLLPIYYVVQYPLVLPLLVVLSAAAGGLVLSRIADASGFAPRLSRCFVLLFLLYYPLHGVIYDNFYAISLVTLPSFLTYLFWRQRRIVPFALACLFLVILRQDASLLVFGWGLFLTAVHWPRRSNDEASRTWLQVGAACMIFELFYLWLSFHVVQPMFNIRGETLLRTFSSLYSGGDLPGLLLACLHNPLQMLTNVFSPQKWKSIAELLFYFAFIPLLRPRTLLIPLPCAMFHLLSNAEFRFPTRDHYVAPFVAFLLLAALEGYGRLQERIDLAPLLPRLTAFAACLSVLLNPTPLHVGWARLPIPPSRNSVVWDCLSLVPADESICVPGCYFPWVANHVDGYAFYERRARWVLIDTKRPKMMAWGHYDGIDPQTTTGYTVVRSADGIYLLQARAKAASRSTGYDPQ